MAPDPYAALSWTTTIAVLALQKLRRSVAINEREKKALLGLADQLELLSRASEISIRDQATTVPTNLRQSLFTLIAIGETSSPQAHRFPPFGQTGRDLRSLCLAAGSAPLDASVLHRVQNTCIELLEHINDQRPRTTVE
jgi:hypothetical protein